MEMGGKKIQPNLILLYETRGVKVCRCVQLRLSFMSALCSCVTHIGLHVLTPLCVAGETVGEEQTAVTIAGVQQAAFADHNVQYQFRTENNGGQVSGGTGEGGRSGFNRGSCNCHGADCVL